MSLCPIQIKDDPLNSSNKIRWFDSSCLEACNNIYLSNRTKASKIDQEKLSSLQEFGNCFNNLPKLNFDYQKCFNDFFTSHKNIADLSNFKLPDYIKYDFTITNLVCNENSVKITIKTEQGTDNLILSMIANKKDGLAVVLQPSNIDAPKVGETKEYALTYPSGTSKDDITHINVLLGTKERAFIEDKAKSC